MVFDFGAGTGRLSIASAYMQASVVFSLDFDPNALKTLKYNIRTLELERLIFPICADVERFEITPFLEKTNTKIISIMNPPFGVQKAKADRSFLKQAFLLSDVVYSIHLTGLKVQNFLTRFADENNWKIDIARPFNMILEKTFNFHTEKKKKIDVTIYRFIKK